MLFRSLTASLTWVGLTAGLGAAALGPQTASAAQTTRQRLALLPIIIEGPSGRASLSSVLRDVAMATDRRPGLRLITAEEMFVASERDLGQRVKQCGSDTQCLAERLRSFDAPLALVVVANFAIEPALISLQLIDTDARRRLGQSVGEVEGGATVSSVIRTRAQALFEDAGFGQAGRIIVTVEPQSAVVQLPGYEPDRGSASIFTVPPGQYNVLASADGYIDGETSADVKSGRDTPIALALEKSPTVLSQWWFWTLVGAAVAGGTTAAIVASQPNTRCLCTTLNGVGCELCQ